MIDDSNRPTNLFTTNNENLTEEPDPQSDRDVWGKESWFEELTYTEFKLMSLISGLSKRDGRCFMNDKSFSKRFDTSDRTIERGLQGLEQKKYIFRNTYARFIKNKINGKQRIIVTRHNAVSYFTKFLNKPSVPLKVKVEFLDHFGLSIGPSINLPPEEPHPKNDGSTPSDKSGGCLRTDKSGGCSIHSIDIDKARERKPKIAAANNSFIRDSKEHLSYQIEHEESFSKNAKQLAQDYLEARVEYIQGRENPFGDIVNALKKGYAQKYSEIANTRKDKELQVEQEKNDVEINKRISQQLKETYKDLTPFVNVYINPCDIRLKIDKYEDEQTFENLVTICEKVISFKDLNFEEKINKFKSRVKQWLKKRDLTKE